MNKNLNPIHHSPFTIDMRTFNLFAPFNPDGPDSPAAADFCDFCDFLVAALTCLHRSPAKKARHQNRRPANLESSRNPIDHHLTILYQAAAGGDTHAARHLAEVALSAATFLAVAEHAQPELLRTVAARHIHWPVLATGEPGWEKAAGHRLAALSLGSGLGGLEARFRPARGADANLPARRWAKLAVRALEQTRWRALAFTTLLAEFGSRQALAEFCLKSGWDFHHSPPWAREAVDLPPFCADSLPAWKRALRAMIRSVLECHFAGRPISEQNLSEWRQGGYLDWLKHQETCDLIRRLSEQAEEFDEAGDSAVSDRLATVLAADLVRLSQALLADTKDPDQRWQRLRELFGELGRLRRDDHRAARLAIERQRWERETEQFVEKQNRRELNEMRRHAYAPLLTRSRLEALAQTYGGGEAGRRAAAAIIEMQDNLTPGTLTAHLQPSPCPPPPAEPSQTQSNQIKPNQSKSK